MPHLRAVNEDLLTHMVKLCDLCYLIILAEMELMDVEAKLALGLSINMKEIDVLHPIRCQKPAYLPEKMCRLRLFLYIKAVTVPGEANWSLKYKLFGRSITKTSGKASFAALFYIFSPLSPSFSLQSLSLSFILKCAEGKLKGSVRPLQHWHKGLGVFCEEMRVGLYAEDWVKGEVVLAIGLSQEGEIARNRVKIGLRRWQGLYLPEENCYFDGEPLPTQWLEAIEASYQLKHIITPKALQCEEYGYTPLMNFDKYARFICPKATILPKTRPKRTASLSKVSVKEIIPEERGKYQLSVPRIRLKTVSESQKRPESFDSEDLSGSVDRYLQGKSIPAIDRLKAKINDWKARNEDKSMEILSPGTSATTVELLPRPRLQLSSRKSLPRAVSARVTRAACQIYR
jgi:hypothetical protein